MTLPIARATLLPALFVRASQLGLASGCLLAKIAGVCRVDTMAPVAAHRLRRAAQHHRAARHTQMGATSA